MKNIGLKNIGLWQFRWFDGCKVTSDGAQYLHLQTQAACLTMSVCIQHKCTQILRAVQRVVLKVCQQAKYLWSLYD